MVGWLVLFILEEAPWLNSALHCAFWSHETLNPPCGAAYRYVDG